MRKNLITIILAVILAICLVFLGLIIYSLIPKECKHYFCDKTPYEPTCDVKGYTLYECKTCDYSFEADFIAPTGHEYTNETVAPTCEDEGYTLHTCSRCEKTEKDTIVSATGHNYAQNIIAPTCETQGCTINYCINCDFETRTDYVKPLGHDKEQSTVAPTCEDEGYNISTCKRENCDYEYMNGFVQPLGHSYVEVSKKNPTCEAEGFSTYKCEICEHEYKGDYTDILGHSYEETEIVFPTCEAKGYTVYKCESCGHEYSGSYVDMLGHNYIEIGTVEPTCLEGGNSTFMCSICDHQYISDYTEPTGHTTYTKTVTKPTCTTEGYTTYKCDKCEYEYKSDKLPPEDHTYKKIYVRPNIEKTGYTINKCIVCEVEHISDYVFYSDIFTGAAGAGEGKLAFGVDLSHWSYSYDEYTQDDVDFEKLKEAGVEFVILRVGFDTDLDSRFEKYYEAAREAGLDIGVYFFTLATNADEARADAKRVASWLDGKTFEYPIFYDIEKYVKKDSYGNVVYNYDPASFGETRIMEITNTFMTAMVEYGYYPGLYTNNDYLYNLFNNEKTLRLYDVWYARYVETDGNLPSEEEMLEYSQMYSMWQYNGDVYNFADGAVPGACDLNIAFKKYPEWIKEHGFNGYD